MCVCVSSAGEEDEAENEGRKRERETSGIRETGTAREMARRVGKRGRADEERGGEGAEATTIALSLLYAVRDLSNKSVKRAFPFSS